MNVELPQNELNQILDHIKTKKSNEEIKELCEYMNKNRSNTDEIIKKISRFFNENDNIPDEVLLNVITSVISILIENSQIINFLNMMLPILIHKIFYSNRTVSELKKIIDTTSWLIKDRGAFIRHIIESNIQSLFDKFSNSSSGYKFENTKYAMIKLLAEIIHAAPLVSFNKIIEQNTFNIFIKILDNFKDSKEEIRLAIYDLITSFLIMLTNKDDNTKKYYGQYIYDRLLKKYTDLLGNKEPSNYCLVAGFLQALSGFTYQKEIIQNDYAHLYKIISPLKNNKIHLIRCSFYNFLPTFVSFDINTFTTLYSNDIFSNMFIMLSKSVELRNAILSSFSALCLILPNIEPFIDNITTFILQCFNKDTVDSYILDCLSNILVKYKNNVIPKIQVDTILKKMFKNGIYSYHTNLICQLLKSYSEDSNEYIKILICMLNNISYILKGNEFPIDDVIKEYNKYNNDDTVIRDIITVTDDLYKIHTKNIDAIINTQSNIKEEFMENSINFLNKVTHKYFLKSIYKFYYNTCLFYLTLNVSNKIKEAVLKLCNSNWIIIYKDEEVYSQYIFDGILDCYLNVIINEKKDCDKKLILNTMDQRYYKRLTQSNFFSKLISALSLSDLIIKKYIIQLIGRIISNNIGNKYILLYLQKSIMKLVNNINNTNYILKKEEDLKLLYLFAKYTKKSFKWETVDLIYKLIIPVLKRHTDNPIINLSIIKIFGEIVSIDNTSENTSLNQTDADYILSVCLNNLREGINTSTKEASLKTMYEIIKRNKIDIYATKLVDDSNTQIVTAPYLELVDILIQILIKNNDNITRKYALCIFGLCGAMDPEKLEKFYTENSMNSCDLSLNIKSNINGSNITDLINSEEMNLVDPVNMQAVISLMKIFKDNSQLKISTQIISCLGGLIKSLQPTDSPLIDIILPTIIEMIPSFEQTYAKSLFEKMIIILKNFKSKFLKYIDKFMQIIIMYLNKENYHDIVFQYFPDVLQEFDLENFYYIIIPIFVDLIKKKSKEIPSILKCLQLMANKLSAYFDIIFPAVLLLYDETANKQIAEDILKFIQEVILLDNAKNFFPIIIQTLLKKISVSKNYAEQTLYIFIYINEYMRNELAIYFPLIVETYKSVGLEKHKSKLKEFILEPLNMSNLIQQLCLYKCSYYNKAAYTKPEKKTKKSSSFDVTEKHTSAKAPLSSINTNLKNRKAQTNRDAVIKEFDTNHCSVEEDWREWFKSTSKVMFEQSPSYALFYCHMVADYYFPLIVDLYNYGFSEVYKILNSVNKQQIVNNIVTALNHPKVPNDILLTILNLAEFMERSNDSINFIDYQTLGNVALKCKAYAKALYYKESDFLNKKDFKSFGQLTSLYHELKLPDSAKGLLKVVQSNIELTDESSWYIKSHEWKEALKLINEDLKMYPQIKDLVDKKVVCLDGLGNWEDLLEIKDNIDNYCLLAKASLNMSDWDNLEIYTNKINDDSNNEDVLYEKNLFNAILQIHHCNYDSAKLYIENAKRENDNKILSLLSESYIRGYESLIKNEILYQLNEIIEYKQNLISKSNIIYAWNKRLKYIDNEPDYFERILAIRSLVLNMNEDYLNYLKLAKICINNNQLDRSFKIIKRIYNKFVIKDNDKQSNEALIRIQLVYNKCLFEDKQYDNAIDSAYNIISKYNLSEIDNTISSKVYCDYALYSIHKFIAEGLKDITQFNNILHNLELSTKYNTNNSKSWQTYALINYKYYNILSEQDKDSDMALQYAINALKGFTQNIVIQNKNESVILQDMLRLLDIWFKCGSMGNMPQEISNSFKIINIDTFLFVLPQLISRIGISDVIISETLLQLLLRIGYAHPLALTYQLIVISNYKSKRQREIAQELLIDIKEKYPALVNECTMLINELNRCAMLLNEQWTECIEEAAKYYNNNDINGMIKTLLQAHEKIRNSPETLDEMHFYQCYYSQLLLAELKIKSYLETNNLNDISDAWYYYFSVYQGIGENYKSFSHISLKNVSPKLYAMKQSKLCIPGLYDRSNKIVQIAGFSDHLTVFPTKQHPRKLCIYGTDHKEYKFLLKGHEDLRLDERAMQLFNLVNCLLKNDESTSHKNLFIKCFSVIPLSTNTGLIGWVPNCDTLHQLIREYRIKKKIAINIEHKFMANFYPKFDSSTFLNKLEVFKSALQNTMGLEIYKVLWNKSVNSEAWLERRTNYSRSLAVMSIVGYILGLGDRHPSNLMMDRHSGKIIHIDFGDCFEVAMKRDKFPEKVPFRLTRMLIKALEVSGIEGTFRLTCESVMKILRDNKDSLLAILSSFVHNPLVSFRLMVPLILKKKNKVQKRPSNINLIQKEKAKAYDDEIRKTVTNLKFRDSAISHTTERKQSFEDESRKAMDLAKRKISNDEGENEKTHYNAKKEMENDERKIILLLEERDEVESEELKKISKIVIDRINDKLSGTDFHKNTVLDAQQQVDKLIAQATSHENLAQSYLGWCPFW